MKKIFALQSKPFVGFGAGILVGLIGCATAADVRQEHKGGNMPEPELVVIESESVKKGDYLPFAIAFKRDGTPVFVDRKGRALKSRPLQFPLETKKIYGLKTITFGAVEGSCDVFMVGGSAPPSITGFHPSVCDGSFPLF